MYNDYDYDYQAYDKKGKEQLVKLDVEGQMLYGWQSTRVHLAEGAGGSVTFKDFLKREGWWHNWIRETFGDAVLAEILEKIKKTLEEH